MDRSHRGENTSRHECDVSYNEDVFRGFGTMEFPSEFDSGFYIRMTVKERTMIRFFNQAIGQWITHYNVNQEDRFLICKKFFLRTVEITEERERAHRQISRMLTEVNIPENEQSYLIEKIYTNAKLLAEQHTANGSPDTKIPLSINITRFHYVHTGPVNHNPFVISMNDDDDEDEAEAEEEEDEFYEDKPAPATKEAIEALEKLKVTESGVDCVICLEEMEFNSEVTCMPCDHKFHGACIVKWLGNKHVCPLCRFALPCVD